jgi:hypothetical protein
MLKTTGIRRYRCRENGKDHIPSLGLEPRDLLVQELQCAHPLSYQGDKYVTVELNKECFVC